VGVYDGDEGGIPMNEKGKNRLLIQTSAKGSRTREGRPILGGESGRAERINHSSGGV